MNKEEENDITTRVKDAVLAVLLRPQAYGGKSFLICKCQGEVVTGMLPVVIEDAHGPFIAAIVCPECDNELAIVNGRPVVSEGGQ